MYKFGIIGGGLLGRLAAFFLNKSGYQVIVYEKSEAKPAQGRIRSAAFTSAGMLSPLSEKESGGDIVYDLGNQSMKIWSQVDVALIQLFGHGIGLKTSGNIFICSPDELPYTKRLFNKLNYYEQPLDIKKIKSLEPNLSSNFKTWLVKGEGHLDPMIAMDLLYKATLVGKNKEKIKWEFNCPISEFGPGWIKVKTSKFFF